MPTCTHPRFPQRFLRGRVLHGHPCNRPGFHGPPAQPDGQVFGRCPLVGKNPDVRTFPTIRTFPPLPPTSRRAHASRLNARLGCLRLSQSGAVQTGCGCRPHTKPLSVGQGRAASRAASKGQHGPAAPPKVSPGEAEAPGAGDPLVLPTLHHPVESVSTSGWSSSGHLRPLRALPPCHPGRWGIPGFRIFFLVPVFYLGLCWVLVVAHQPFSGCDAPAPHCGDFSRCGAQPQSWGCPAACGIFPDQGSDRRLLHRKVDA